MFTALRAARATPKLRLFSGAFPILLEFAVLTL
jgi:hypothetical protein